MKIKKFKMHALIFSSMLLLLASFAGEKDTLSYLSSTVTKTNNLEVGEVKIETSMDGTMPSSIVRGINEYAYNVSVANTGNVPCYVRMYVGFSDSRFKERTFFYKGTFSETTGISDVSDMTKKEIHDTATANMTCLSDLTEGDKTYKDWIYGGDGYYYYPYAIKPESGALFTEAISTVIEDDSGLEEYTGNYEIFFYAEAIQATDPGNTYSKGTNSSYSDLWEAFLARKESST